MLPIKFHNLTLSGFDDTLSVDTVNQLHEKHSFEMGVLIHSQHQGNKARYPSLKWISSLQTFDYGLTTSNFSFHICGQYMRDFLLGNPSLPIVSNYFCDRVQFNLHGCDCMLDSIDINLFLLNCQKYFPSKKIIIQLNSYETYKFFKRLIHVGFDNNITFQPFFDTSSGKGIRPKYYVRDEVINLVQYYYKCYKYSPTLYIGFAGGISEDNLEEVYNEIIENSDDLTTPNTSCMFWLDIESGIRNTNEPNNIILDKIENCLYISEQLKGN